MRVTRKEGKSRSMLRRHRPGRTGWRARRCYGGQTLPGAGNGLVPGPSRSRDGGQRSPGRIVAQDPGPRERVSREQCGTAYHADGHQVVQRPAGVHHDDQLAARPQYPVDFALRLLDLRHICRTPWLNTTSKLSSGTASRARCPVVAPRREARAAPAGSGPFPRPPQGGQRRTSRRLADQALGLSAFAQSDLKHLLADHVQCLDMHAGAARSGSETDRSR